MTHLLVRDYADYTDYSIPQTSMKDERAARESNLSNLHNMRIELISIDQTGNLTRPVGALPELCRQNCERAASFYRVVGFVPPWIGYVSLSEGRVVGGGGFKGPPKDNKVEIAYYTLPEFERRGIATATARELIETVRNAVPGILVTAQTLPVPNASNSILKKLGFKYAGTANDGEVGEVWVWELRAESKEHRAKS